MWPLGLNASYIAQESSTVDKADGMGETAADIGILGPAFLARAPTWRGRWGGTPSNKLAVNGSPAGPAKQGLQYAVPARWAANSEVSYSRLRMERPRVAYGAGQFVTGSRRVRKDRARGSLAVATACSSITALLAGRTRSGLESW